MTVQHYENTARSPRSGVVDAIQAGNAFWGEMFLHLQEAAIADRSELLPAELMAIGQVVLPPNETNGLVA